MVKRLGYIFTKSWAYGACPPGNLNVLKGIFSVIFSQKTVPTHMACLQLCIQHITSVSGLQAGLFAITC